MILKCGLCNDVIKYRGKPIKCVCGGLYINGNGKIQKGCYTYLRDTLRMFIFNCYDYNLEDRYVPNVSLNESEINNVLVSIIETSKDLARRKIDIIRIILHRDFQYMIRESEL